MKEQLSCEELQNLRRELMAAAWQAKNEPQPEQRSNWIAPEMWSRYMGAEGMQLYKSFTDEELLDIIRGEAEILGRIPAQREIFCVYRDYILRRFGNWVKALEAAGVRKAKKSKIQK